MTEIKIEKKKPVWPWILLVLFLLFVSWFFFIRNDKAEVLKTVDQRALIDIHEKNQIVVAYVTFINSDPNTMGQDHEFTSEAFTKLTNAIDAMATEADYDIKADMIKVKQRTDEITKDPMVTTHGDKIRSAADALSTSLTNMQQAKYPELSNEAADVKSAAVAIDPQTLTLDQRDAVKSFFTKTADLLNKMN
ncbi:hypothetical protein [Flavobacterium tegetincola]|jgi:hypothetical protein|uniref:hypothetical protein n=1 Tax=Flavobacterium tegetincola TaxID=150172 RepID=UPI00040AFFF7|nr:hypothetical protein [Flavobacterium tegetincola]